VSGRATGLGLAVAVLLAGCTSTGFGGTRSTERSSAEIQELQSRVLELQRQAAVAEVELERLRARVAELETRAGVAPPPPPAAAPRPRAETGAPTRSAEPVVEIEDVGEGEPSHGRPAPPAAPPPAVEEPPSRAAPPSASRPSPRPVPPAGTGPVSEAAQALYDRGYTLYHQGRYVDAESSFQRFIQAYPDTELSDNAQYWIGESRLARGDDQGALAAFRETVERYPRGNKVPDALLKVGESLAGLGDVEGAREAYREVTRRFAGTTAAAVAEDRLKELP
jgi:tol-pal system protein YbgF